MTAWTSISSFVSGTPAEVLDQARKAVGDLDIRLGGGPTTINEFLQAVPSGATHLFFTR